MILVRTWSKKYGDVLRFKGFFMVITPLHSDYLSKVLRVLPKKLRMTAFSFQIQLPCSMSAKYEEEHHSTQFVTCRYIMNAQSDRFPKPEMARTRIGRVLGEGLVWAEGSVATLSPLCCQ